MKLSTIISLSLSVCLTLAALAVLAQEPSPDPVDEPSAEAVANEDGADSVAPAAEALEWSDYSVKAYSLTFWGGNNSGATYFENPVLDPLTILTVGAGDIIGYDGETLIESRDLRHYDAAVKEIKSGDAFGGRIGIYIADDFHLDMVANYASGEAITSMIYTEEPDLAPDVSERVVVDSDPGFKVYKGGVSLMYNASPARLFGIVPRLGFGLGGIINRFSQLEDKTALYLEANFGLNWEFMENLSLEAQADLTSFAFEVDELGYSNMTNYKTYSVGLSWFIDRVPEPVRAAHIAAAK